MAAEQMTTGQRIARARRRKGWDQTTLAEKFGRSVSWLSKIENGRLPLDRMSVLGQVAEVLGVEIAELTGQPYRHETDELDGSTSIVAGRRVEGTTKSGRSRLISIDTETVDVLREHHRRQGAERLTAGRLNG